MPQKELTSKAFKSQKRAGGKEFRAGTLGEALDDLYADIDAGFAALEGAAVDDIADPANSSIEDNANKINALLAQLRAKGIIAE
jgi:hypothetical protein